LKDTSIFEADFFTANRKVLLDRSGARVIALAANGLLQRSADTTFPFRQDSNFWYLTGIEEPDYTLVITDSETFLISPKRAEHRDVWDGAIDKKALKAQSGISRIMEYHAGWIQLDLLIKKHKKVHTIAPAEAYLEHFGFYTNPARQKLLTAISKHRKAEVVDIRKVLAYQRQIKQKPELRALQTAIDITASTLKDVQKRLDLYKTEYEISADITQGFLARGASGHAYQPIVASGKNAATIHYVQSNAEVLPNNFLLLDVGAEVSNYSADITRTYQVGSLTPRQQAIYQAVLRVKAAATELLCPGVLMKEYEQKVDALMALELKELKLISDIHDKKQLKKYYPHLTSHFLGLDTHDAADYFLPLEPGMVLTVEPGVYIPEEGIGIRIEDNVLITSTGVDNLSAALLTNLS
jgi:Xaa-Pro aminopeptidase